MDKLTQMTGEEALTDFALNGVNKNIRMVHDGKPGFYIEELTISVCMAFLDDSFGMAKSREWVKQQNFVKLEQCDDTDK